MTAEATPQPADFIFLRDGEPVHHNHFYKTVYLPNLPQDLKGTTWHELRHTCASLLINSARERGQTDPEVIAWQVTKYLGHKHVTTTLQIYTHLLPGAQEALAASLDAGGRKAERAQPSTVIELPAERVR